MSVDESRSITPRFDQASTLGNFKLLTFYDFFPLLTLKQWPSLAIGSLKQHLQNEASQFPVLAFSVPKPRSNVALFELETQSSKPRFMQDSNWTLEDRKLRTSLHRACIHHLLSDLPFEVREALLKTNIVIGWHYRYHRYVVLHTVTLEEAEQLANHHEVIISRLQNLLGTFRFAIAEGYPGETRGVLVKCIREIE